MRVPIGVCRGCGHPLHGDPDHEVPDPQSLEDDERWALSHALAFGRMLECAQSGAPSRDGFARLLSFALDGASARGVTRRGFSCLLGVPARHILCLVRCEVVSEPRFVR